jgi:hypothetical protein
MQIEFKTILHQLYVPDLKSICHAVTSILNWKHPEMVPVRRTVFKGT